MTQEKYKNKITGAIVEFVGFLFLALSIAHCMDLCNIVSTKGGADDFIFTVIILTLIIILSLALTVMLWIVGFKIIQNKL